MLTVLKGIHKVKRRQADGSVKVHYYAWRGGPKMKAKPHTEAFIIEFGKLKSNAIPKTIDTLASLIDRFTGSDHAPNPDFIKLADSTQIDHRYAFKLIKKHWPQLPVTLTQQKGMKADIRKWHHSFAKNPRKADKLLFSLSKVFSYAIADELIDKNPCTGIDRLYDGSRRDSVWSPEQIEKFRTGAEPHLLLPFEIALLTCQRQGDILALVPKAYDETHLSFKQSKTGKMLKVKVHSRLKEMLDKLPKDVLRICLNSRKRPWTKDGFKTSWGKELIRLEIKDVTFHDLRGTFITEAARRGEKLEDIIRISGHTYSEARTVLEKHYLAPDQDLSDALIDRMEKNPTGTKTVNAL